MILSISNLSQGFDTDEWVSKFCNSSPKGQKCEEFNFTKEEREDIQNSEFVISNETSILFENGNIGVLNEHFLEKFPYAHVIRFKNIIMQLDESTKSINHPVTIMEFESCEINGVQNSNFFQTLPDLNQLTIRQSKFDHKVVEKSLFDIKSELKLLSLISNDISGINDDAFEGLTNLEHLDLTDSLETLSPNLLTKLLKLRSLNLASNHLHEVPCDAIPENMVALFLSGNEIHELNFENCKFQSNLKYLTLYRNGIESIDESTFDAFPNLEYIDLGHNKFERFSNVHIKNLPHLKRIYFEKDDKVETDISSDIVEFF